MIEKGDAPGGQLLLGQRGQDNFKLAANFGYGSRGSADPRKSLRKRRILKLALTAHKVLLAGERFRRGLCIGEDVSFAGKSMFLSEIGFCIDSSVIV